MPAIHRYFIGKGKTQPLIKEINRLFNLRRASHSKLKAFMKKHGIENIFGHSPKTYLFDFDKMPDASKWTKVKRGRQILFRPRRNTAEGKAITLEVQALPEFPDLNDAINIVPGLANRSMMVFTGARVYYPFIRYFSLKSNTVIISVPSIEPDPKKLAAYKKKGERTDSNMEAALWEPPAYLKPIKEWEVLKLLDEA